MITYENECCDCASDGYPCIGDICPNRRVKHLYCDRCEQDAEKLYINGIEQLCEECLLEEFEVVEI